MNRTYCPPKFDPGTLLQVKKEKIEMIDSLMHSLLYIEWNAAIAGMKILFSDGRVLEGISPEQVLEYFEPVS